MEQHGVTGQDDGLAASDLVIETMNVTAEETAAIFAVLQSVAHGPNPPIPGDQRRSPWPRSLGPLRPALTAETTAWKDFLK